MIEWSVKEMMQASCYGKFYIVHKVTDVCISLYELNRRKNSFYVNKKKKRDLKPVVFDDGSIPRVNDLFYITSDNVIDLFPKENFKVIK